jgi:apolipoprotein N-acyltransferase
MLSGLVLAFAYFPFDLLVPNLVAFLPMLFWLDSRLDAPRARLRGGFVFGLAVHLTILHWMYAMIAISVLAIALYLLLAGLFAACVAISTTAASWLRRELGWSWAALLPLTWLPVEWAATWGDTRMTAHHLGNTLSGFPFLVQFADLTGPYGVGAFLLIVNGLFYDLVDPRSRRRLPSAVALVLVLAAVVGYDTWKWSHPPEATGWIRVALVQPNIPLVEKMDPDQDERQWNVLEEMTVRAAKTEKPALVVWPETARPKALWHDVSRPETYAMPDVQTLARDSKVAILAGAEYARIDGNHRSYYNAAFLVDREGHLDETWTAKVYLVPFVEKTPFEPILGRLLKGRPWLGGGFRPGPEATTLGVAGTKVGVLVCYEELYWDLVRKLRNAGSGFAVIITNDAWFGRTVFQEYQANTVRMRAIENRMALVRVANTGISGFVDPMGRYTGETALFVTAVEAEDVPITAEKTIYTRYGDYVAWLAIAGLALASASVTIRERRRRTA